MNGFQISLCMTKIYFFISKYEVVKYYYHLYSIYLTMMIFLAIIFKMDLNLIFKRHKVLCFINY